MDNRRGLPRKLNLEELKSYAHRTLTARPLSIAELRAKLRLKAAEPADIETVIAGLKEYKALDDERFAQQFSASRKENRGFGAGRVLRDLRQRRVSAPLAEKAVSELYAEADESELIAQYLARKYRNKNLKELLQDPKQLASAFRKLRAAGFSSARSLAVLKRYSALASDITEDEIE